VGALEAGRGARGRAARLQVVVPQRARGLGRRRWQRRPRRPATLRTRPRSPARPESGAGPARRCCAAPCPRARPATPSAPPPHTPARQVAIQGLPCQAISAAAADTCTLGCGSGRALRSGPPGALHLPRHQRRRGALPGAGDQTLGPSARRSARTQQAARREGTRRRAAPQLEHQRGRQERQHACRGLHMLLRGRRARPAPASRRRAICASG